MTGLVILIVILGTFTGYIVGRARGYHLGYGDAQTVYSKALDDTMRAAGRRPPPDYPIEESTHE